MLNCPRHCCSQGGEEMEIGEKKAEVKVKIKTILNDGLPEVYDKRIFDDKRSSLYDYVYESM